MLRRGGGGIESGVTGACMGLLLAGPLTVLFVAILLPISYVFGYEPADGSLGYGLLALPLALVACLSSAFYLAVRSGGYRSVTVAGSGLGFTGFWSILAAVLLTDWL